MTTGAGGERLLTPSKITAWLDCAHYLTLRRQVDDGALVPTNAGRGSLAGLLMDKGLTHERDYLDSLRARGLDVFEVSAKERGETFATWASRVAGVLADGHDVVYQFPFVHDGLRGVADFLVKVDTPSALGNFSYEPVDAKLARTAAKPGHVLQLAFYADALEAAQETRSERVHLYLGSGETESIRLRDVEAYWRRIRHQLARVMATELGDGATVPVKCTHCEFCEFADHCDAEWRRADSLIYVAGIRGPDIDALEDSGVPTMAALAEGTGPIAGVKEVRLDVLRSQAVLQRRASPGSPPPFETVPADNADEESRRRRQLPAPDPGDVFLDFEGHPFWTPARGLIFLAGLLVRGGDGKWEYESCWAHTVAEEAAMTRGLIDWIAERRARHPGMHVYHYNHTERSLLVARATEHGADEALLARLVANGVFVDMLDVVRHSVSVGAESYSLKVLEVIAGYDRSHDIDHGAGAVVEYEGWMGDGDADRLDRIARYNADDVRATLAVREWLLAEPLAGEPARTPIELEDEELDGDVDDLVAGLVATGEDWKVLLAHLLEYWSREGRAHRAQAVAPLASEPGDQLEHPAVIAGLEFVEMRPRQGRQKSDRAVFRFPPQPLTPDLTDVRPPRLMYPVGDGVVSVSADSVDPAGELVVAWNERADEAPMPTAAVLNDWVGQRPKPEALAEYARRVLDGSETADDTVRRAVLCRSLPAFTAGGGPGSDGFIAETEAIVDAALHLDRSYLAVQGPPGTGKTYTGAHIVARLIAEGRRVGVTAFSHAAINNLVRAVMAVRPDVRVLRHGPRPAREADQLAGATYNADRAKWDSGRHDLVAGTTWLFSGPKMVESLDVLVIDEAGQLGLADALAAMSSATNVILLGDPLQLAQVSLASHPGGAGASVLEHVLGDHDTIPPNRGVFLDTTRRMHPDVCSFVSTQVYEGRLGSHPGCAAQSVGGEAGLRWVRAEHTGSETYSVVEAALVHATIRSLVDSTWVDADGVAHVLSAADVMVVAPYNDHVDLVRGALDADPVTAAARVGTVDKFQGQEAPVVIFTMATSSGDCMPRTAEFLYSRNRLNVAISRARALAYIICTDELLDTRARTVDEMRMIGTLCAFVEAAEHV